MHPASSFSSYYAQAHIHCIVPAASYSLNGDWKRIGTLDDYLYPVHQFSVTFKEKFLDRMERALRKTGMLNGFNPVIKQARNKPWIVFCEPSLARPEHVIRYLGKYTHQVAIANDRILSMSEFHVTFVAKDYRDHAQKKPVTMTGVEFLHRFCLHILPKRFVKIRRYSIYTHTTKRNLQLQFVPQESKVEKKLAGKKEVETTQERIKPLTGYDIGKWPKCKNGRMHIIRELPCIRSPSQHVLQLLFAYLQ